MHKYRDLKCICLNYMPRLLILDLENGSDSNDKMMTFIRESILLSSSALKTKMDK